ncbi:MAG: bifunctional folylpolyglutamate synthase/dihydrofolate synthase [Acidimicrobiales bacterium]
MAGESKGPPFSILPEALAWLDGHIDYESKMPSRRSLPTLDRIRELAHLLGNPERSLPCVHLTGTNGKGSTASMVSSLMDAMGLTVGTYTSPNLARVNERIARNGAPIDDASFTEVLSTLASLEGLLSGRPTRFELLTAAALAWFSDVAVDVGVIEVGVGGTWDSTNVVEGDVAVITNISYDHTDILGPTLEGIATDKAGIVKAGSTVVVGERDPDLVALIQGRAQAAGAGAVWVLGRDFHCSSNRLALGGRLVDVETPGGSYKDVLVSLNGPHQGPNAACSVAAAEAFFGRPLGDNVVTSALSSVTVPGRLEVAGHRPLVLIDGAHNVAGMHALCEAVLEGFVVNGPVVAVVGMLRGRDPTAMLSALSPLKIATLIVCEPSSPRAIAAEVVAQAGAALGTQVEIVQGVGEAMSRAARLVPEDGMLLVAGSLYVVADAREHLASPARQG